MATSSTGPRNSLPPPDVLSSIMANNPHASAIIAGLQATASASAASVASVAAAASAASAASQASEASVISAVEQTQDVSAAATGAVESQSGVALTGAATLAFSSAQPTDVSSAETSDGGQTTAASTLPATGATQLSQTASPELASGVQSGDASKSPTDIGSSGTLATVTSPVSTPTGSAASEDYSNLRSQAPTSLHGSYYTTSATSSDAAVLPPVGRAQHQGLSSGAIAAAVLVPLLFLLGLVAAVFLLFRRRNRRNTRFGSAGAGAGAFGFPVMKQRSPSHRVTPSAGAMLPVVTNNRNSAYYTGLDTASSRMSSQHARDPSGEEIVARTSMGGTTFYEPPPAYKKLSSLGSDGSPPEYARNLPHLEPSENDAFDPFSDPESPTSLHNPLSHLDLPSNPPAIAAAAAAVAPNPTLLASPTSVRPGTSRSDTNISINSDLYSDTASVHSARAARMSIGGANVIQANGSQLNLEQMPQHTWQANDPFQGPVSPL